MEVDIDDQLMENLLRSTIAGIGVPFTYIDATNDVEFARSLSMQNQGFVKKIVNYQEQFGTYFTNIIRDMYEYEFGKTEHDKARDSRIANAKKGKKDEALDDIIDLDVTNIFIQFPEPVLLAVTTSNEQIEATSSTIEYISGLYMEDPDSDEGRVFKKRLAKDVFLKNLDWDLYDTAFEEAQKDLQKKGLDQEVIDNLKGEDGKSSDEEEDSLF